MNSLVESPSFRFFVAIQDSSLKARRMDASRPAVPTFGEAFWVWVKIGLLSFGGPTGQISLMHEELVDRRRWVSDSRFLHALNYCMLLPGPEAQQLTIYLGWLMHRTWGGIMAGTLFVLPGAALLWLVSWVYMAYGDVPWIEAVFYGLKPAVMGIVAHATIRIGRKALKNVVMWSVAAAAFSGIFFLNLPFPLIVFSAGVVGLIGGWLPGGWFDVVGAGSGNPKDGAVIHDDAAMADHHRPSVIKSVRTAMGWLVVWATPVAGAAAIFGPGHVLAQMGVFFSKAALVGFGGAYAVLPYVAQQAVEAHEWLTAAQMLDGLGLAETTPGPLVLVLQFVGFVGGWQHAGEWVPLAAATLAALITIWCTFMPGFLFIFLGAPFIEALRGQKALTCALSAITAAVVGVILNLAVWFALGVLFQGEASSLASIDWFSAVLALAVFLGMTFMKWDVIKVVPACGLIGVIWQLMVMG